MDVDDFKQREMRKFQTRNEKPFDVADLDFWEPYEEGVFPEELDFAMESTAKVEAIVEAAHRRLGIPHQPKMMAELRAKTDLVLLKVAYEFGFRYFLYQDARWMHSTALAMLKSNLFVRVDKTATPAQLRNCYAWPCLEGVDGIFTEDQLIELNRAVERANAYFVKRPEEREKFAVWHVPIRVFPEVWRVGVTFRFGEGDSEDSVLRLANFVKESCPFLFIAGLTAVDEIDLRSVRRLRRSLAKHEEYPDVERISLTVRVSEELLGSEEEAPFIDDALRLGGTVLRIPNEFLFSETTAKLQDGKVIREC